MQHFEKNWVNLTPEGIYIEEECRLKKQTVSNLKTPGQVYYIIYDTNIYPNLNYMTYQAKVFLVT